MSPVIPDASEITVLIPAAGRAPEGLLALSNIECPAMIPVAGRPVVHWTISYLQSLGLRRFVIAVARRGMFIEDFVECGFGATCDVTFVTPTRDGGVGDTIADLAKVVDTRSALVVLGDTHFQFAEPGVLSAAEPFVLVSDVEESYRWCVADTDAGGRISALHDKVPDLPAPLQALIGVYYFPDAAALRVSAAEAAAEAEASGRRTELKPILDRVRARTAIRAVRTGDWLDCGNPDRQAASHQALLQKRSFNEVTIDSTMGAIRKRSRHVDKFVNEINYLRLLPKELQVLFPRVLDYSVEYTDPHLTLEYYGYPTLADIFLYENVDAGIWERIFHHLRDIEVGGFMRAERPLPKGAVEEMYLTKTRRRIEAVQGPPELLRLIRHEGSIRVNGRELPNLPLLWEPIEREVAKLAGNARGTVIHGDLCFSNILYDLRSRICKFVDPRGSFGVPGIYGDPRYDVAKLYHSARGLYDFLTNDLFHLSVDGNSIELDVRARPQHRAILARFEKVFFERFDRREILLLTGLLFAAMLPLHDDQPKRQLGMYATSLQLLGGYFGP